MDELLMDLQVFCPRVLEKIFENEVLLKSLSFSFERIRHSGPAKFSDKIRAQVTYF